MPRPQRSIITKNNLLQPLIILSMDDFVRQLQRGARFREYGRRFRGSATTPAVGQI
jgi:hypothetical protein